jgi:hypothetical protein
LLIPPESTVSGLFDVDPTGSPVLPYAGTSGWSGSDTSRERAERDDVDGTTSRRQSQVIFLLAGEGALGATWKEVADRLGWHHGQASGALSVLHKEGKVDRLTTRRNRCSVYVLPQFRLGRDAAPHGRRRTPPEREILLDLIAELRDQPDYGVTGEFLGFLADSYEYRLRVVTGDE